MSRYLHDERTSNLNTGFDTNRQRFGDRDRAFLYPELTSAKDDIRLLEVHPHDDRNHISCTLTPWNRVAASRHGYRALSYCWGSADVQHIITINGREFKVQQNLYEFLEHAAQRRAQHKPGWRTGVYWIDAVCINQQDEDEKAVQLGYMSNVYLSASGTCIWLGPEDRHISRALAFIESCYKEEMTDTGRKSSSRMARTMEMVLPRLSLVLSVPYWKRVWILQEIAASDHARMVSPSSQVGHIRVVCGRSEVPWSFLMVLPLLAQIHSRSEQMRSQQLKDLIRETHGVWLISWLYAAESGARLSLSPYGTLRNCMRLDLPLLIYLSENSQATVPQDYIYGLIGLLDEDCDPYLAPTMKLSGCQVLCHAMRSMVKISIDEGGRKTRRLKEIAMNADHGSSNPVKLGRRGKHCCGTQHTSRSDRKYCEKFSSCTSHCDALESCRAMARYLRRGAMLATIKPEGSRYTIRVLRDCVERKRDKSHPALVYGTMALLVAYIKKQSTSDKNVIRELVKSLSRLWGNAVFNNRKS